MTHVTCRLTAKNWDQLQNPTLGNRVWVTFTFFSTDGMLFYLYVTYVFIFLSLLAVTSQKCRMDGW